MKKLAVLMFALLLPSVLLAQGPGSQFGGPGQGRGAKADGQGFGQGQGRGMVFFKDLDLTQEQRTQLRALKDKRQDTRGSWSEMKGQRDELRQLLADPNVDESEIRRRAEQMREKQAKMFSQRLDNMLEVRRIVGPEKFGKMADKFRERMQERIEGGLGNGGGAGPGAWGANGRERGQRFQRFGRGQGSQSGGE